MGMSIEAPMNIHHRHWTGCTFGVDQKNNQVFSMRSVAIGSVIIRGSDVSKLLYANIFLNSIF